MNRVAFVFLKEDDEDFFFSYTEGGTPPSQAARLQMSKYGALAISAAAEKGWAAKRRRQKPNGQAELRPSIT
jgi:hypothetical protein